MILAFYWVLDRLSSAHSAGESSETDRQVCRVLVHRRAGHHGQPPAVRTATAQDTNGLKGMILIFGRSWWSLFLVIGAVVLLTLLLAPDAYLAIGFAFVLLLLATLGVIVSARATSVHEERTQPTPVARYRHP